MNTAAISPETVLVTIVALSLSNVVSLVFRIPQALWSIITSLLLRRITGEVSMVNLDANVKKIIKRDHLVVRLWNFSEGECDGSRYFLGTSLHLLNGRWFMYHATTFQLTARYYSQLQYSIISFAWNDWSKVTKNAGQKVTSVGYLSIIAGELRKDPANVILPAVESYFLSDGLLEIANSVENFLKPETKAECLRVGRRHTLNILLHGTPGTGKTRFATYLASRFDRPLNIVSPGSQLSESCVNSLRKEMSNSINLVDEFEKCFPKGGDETVCELATARWNSLLDGEHSGDGAINVLACNDITRIPAQIHRPLRIRHTLLMPNFSSDLIAKVFSHWTKESTRVEKGEFSAYDGKLAPAVISQCLEEMMQEGTVSIDVFKKKMDACIK